MQKNRNKFLIVSLVFLLLISSGLYVFTKEEGRPDINRGLFRLAETEKIDQVTLKSPGRSITLKFENNKWRVNDTWDADTRMIKVLFATLKQVEPRRPVAASMRDSIKSRLTEKGTKVSLFSGGGKMQDFFAGGNTLKTETWFLKEGDSQPYSMIIPGYRVYVNGILELDESGWRNKRIFDFNWRNFKSLTSSYSKDPKENFEIAMKDGYFGIRNMEAVDTTKLNNYLDAVSLLFASKFVPSNGPGADSLGSASPGVKIEIKDIANRTYSLELFTPRSKDNTIYGRLGDGQIVSLDKATVAEIVRKREYFKTR
ncbi:MAG: DUF4340 domain-containing protein [Bacteroidota bacterium]